jgi:hypothetical protein
MATFGSTVNDEDPCTLEELRGNVETAKQVTIEGLFLEVDVMKQKMEHMTENMNKMVGLIVTLQGQYEALNAARARELNFRVAGGPTVVTDADDQPSNV